MRLFCLHELGGRDILSCMLDDIKHELELSESESFAARIQARYDESEALMAAFMRGEITLVPVDDPTRIVTHEMLPLDPFEF